MTAGLRVRAVRPDDADAIAAIYAPYVRDTAITFELDPPDAAAMRGRIDSVSVRFPWIVAERGGAVLGYAYADLYRTRAAYRWAVETTVYVDRDHPREGIGRALYPELIARAAAAGFVTALGVIALPNAASVALHEAMGFVHAGTQAGVGYKFSRWHDVGFWQRDLALRRAEQSEPSAYGQLCLLSSSSQSPGRSEDVPDAGICDGDDFSHDGGKRAPFGFSGLDE